MIASATRVVGEPAAIVKRRRIAAPVGRVWLCLTDPRELAQWFADADRMAPDAPFVLGIGDGDFFAGRITKWLAPEPESARDGELGLSWRFLGIGPEFSIAYRLRAQAGGTTLLEVSDRGALTKEEARGLDHGWDDFLDRLDRYLSTAASARFEYSEEFAAGALLRGAHEPAIANMRAWTARAFPGARVAIHYRASDAVELTFTDPAWAGRTTRAAMDACRTAAGVYVRVTHSGWPELDPDRRLAERRRYALAWRAALAAVEEASLQGAADPWA